MKKSTLLYISIIFITGVLAIGLISSLIIKDTKPEHCVVATETIIEITEGTSHDIVFSDSHGDRYYINRGLEHGLNLDSLNAKVLNKTVTLHLAKLWVGTSKHIAQLAIDNDIIYTEFN